MVKQQDLVSVKLLLCYYVTDNVPVTLSHYSRFRPAAG